MLSLNNLNSLVVNHAGKSGGRGLSPRIWSRLLGGPLSTDGLSNGVFAGDDFMCVKNADTYTDLFSEQAYTSYIDTGGTLLGSATQKGGVLNLYVNGDANEEIWISAGDGTQQLGQISDTAADAHLTIFECRFKLSDIDNEDMSWFVGLTAPGAIGNSFLADTSGAIKATTQFLGFRNLLNGDNIQCIYQAAADSAAVINVAAAGDVAADTWVKLGFVYDPMAVTSQRIKWFVNNVELGTYVTGTQIATATFPDAEAFTFAAGFKNVTAAAATMGIDWWAFYQDLSGVGV